MTNRQELRDCPSGQKPVVGSFLMGSKDQGLSLEVGDRSGGLEVAGHQCRLLRVVFRRFEARFEFEWPWWPEIDSRRSGSSVSCSGRYEVLVLVRSGCRDRSDSGRCTYSCKAFRFVGSGSGRCTYSCKAFRFVDSGSGRCTYSCKAFRFVDSGSGRCIYSCKAFRFVDSVRAESFISSAAIARRGNQKFYIVRRRWRFVAM